MKTIYSIYAFILFILLMFLALPFVLFALFFGEERGGNMIYKVCKIWAFIWYLLIGIRQKTFKEEMPDPNQHYIFVANHISYLDITSVVLSVNQPFRILGKHEMIHYPVFGWIYKSAVILVDRKDAKSREKSVRALNTAIRKGISVFIFPEGTFNESHKPLKSFYDGAFRLAIQTKTSIKPILFLDTHKRLHFNSIFSLNPGICRSVYLPEISVDGYTSKDVNALKNKVFLAMEDGLKRFDCKD
jgi:1-acyl-sn-glycerol-3-phosphate acyltransferase